MAEDRTGLAPDPGPPGAGLRTLQLPGYQLLSVAGRGGMGVVYKAEQASPRRIVAVKLLSAVTPSQATLDAFQREAAVIASLEHPHILPLYDFGEHAGQPYLVLRFLSGGSAAARLRRGPVPAVTVARWVRAVSAALDFAHARGLVHRDVKPSNILLDDTGPNANAYLTDFGIAGTLAAAGDGTPTGSAAYMPPEQGRGGSVDRRGDVYALAVTVFELLTGQQPYSAETALGVIVRHINDPIPSARALNPNISPAVDELLRWGMAKEPAERPQTAGEFSRLLDQALSRPEGPLRVAAGPAAAAPTALVEAPAALPRRAGPLAQPALLIGAALAVACLLGALALGGGGLALALFGGAATATSPPTSATAPAPTLPPALDGVLLADDFANPNSGFAAPSDEDGGVAYVDGALRFSVLAENVEWYSPSRRVNAQDVALEVEVAPPSGPAESHLGAICRWQNADNHTAFALSGAGDYAIWQRRDSELTMLVGWTALPSDVAESGGHVLSVTCAGDSLRLDVDGITIAEVDDPAAPAGDVALLAGRREPGELVVDFDNLTVSEP